MLDRLALTLHDLASEAYFRDPHPYWARMRLDQPVFHDPVRVSLQRLTLLYARLEP